MGFSCDVQRSRGSLLNDSRGSLLNDSRVGFSCDVQRSCGWAYLLAYLLTYLLTALSRLGFGVLNKVALFFDEPFWKHTSNFFGRVVGNPRHRGRFFLFFNLLPAASSPVLLALAAGAAAAELEVLDDEQVTRAPTYAYAYTCTHARPLTWTMSRSRGPGCRREP